MNIIPLLNHDSKIPLHRQAEELLRKLIKENHFREGDIFPKETALAMRWGISRNTVRQAINSMVKDGLLERKKKSGTRICKKKITTDLSNWFSFTHEMEVKGVPFKTIKHEVRVVKSDEDVALRLQIAIGVPLVSLERIRSTDKNPMVYFESYFHPRLGLTGNENFEQPLYEMLDKEYNVVPMYSQEEIRAIVADQKIAALLNIDKNTPVMERKRLVLDAGKRPIEYNICFYRGDCFTYSIEIKRSIEE